MFLKQTLAIILSGSLLLASSPTMVAAQAVPEQPAPPPVVRQTPDQLQQLGL